MPQWLSNQLMRAFQQKDLRQVRLLNDCWFFYRTKEDAKQSRLTAQQDL
ncbi:cortex morphogenetic protein CmpA [Paenibacillus herberti]|uniref:Cortex morphogenetic protein CmpA n=1 Tax=Paenibacillus herberti TaxID=1619309 RepID=A0A229NTG0_9BACL|nr:cortex morphogenetic protein CmpA [Paenibacillus herberti]OXM13138.1 cortex morphogenetic protein CmpA [Paenibacillus herberti]